jgi:hypothetical protein
MVYKEIHMALIINGTAGNDNLAGGEYSADILDGLAGNDTLWGYSGDDLLLGNMGNDLLSAGDGNDIGLGGSGADSVWMGAGNDLADGGSGSDLIGGGSGNDLLWGDNGFTEADSQAIAWTLAQAEDLDDLGSLLNVGMTQLLNATGNYARDWQSHDTIWAGTGSDIAFGGLGNDVIGGGTGNDASRVAVATTPSTVLLATTSSTATTRTTCSSVGRVTTPSPTVVARTPSGAGTATTSCSPVTGRVKETLTPTMMVLSTSMTWTSTSAWTTTPTPSASKAATVRTRFLAFDARKGYQNAEDLIDLTAYNYGSMDDVNLVNYTVAQYNALDIDGNSNAADDDLDPTVAQQVDGVALIQNPSCCNCYGVSENSITIAYIGDFDSSNILL